MVSFSFFFNTFIAIRWLLTSAVMQVENCSQNPFVKSCTIAAHFLWRRWWSERYTVHAYLVISLFFKNLILVHWLLIKEFCMYKIPDLELVIKLIRLNTKLSIFLVKCKILSKNLKVYILELCSPHVSNRC